MNRNDYFRNCRKLLDDGVIEPEVYDAMIMNVDDFCEPDEPNEIGDDFGEEDESYMRSAEGRDYSPGNPWDAPGMSIRDFI